MANPYSRNEQKKGAIKNPQSIGAALKLMQKEKQFAAPVKSRRLDNPIIAPSQAMPPAPVVPEVPSAVNPAFDMGPNTSADNLTYRDNSPVPAVGTFLNNETLPGFEVLGMRANQPQATERGPVIPGPASGNLAGADRMPFDDPEAQKILGKLAPARTAINLEDFAEKYQGDVAGASVKKMAPVIDGPRIITRPDGSRILTNLTGERLDAGLMQNELVRNDDTGRSYEALTTKGIRSNPTDLGPGKKFFGGMGDFGGDSNMVANSGPLRIGGQPSPALTFNPASTGAGFQREASGGITTPRSPALNISGSDLNRMGARMAEGAYNRRGQEGTGNDYLDALGMVQSNGIKGGPEGALVANTLVNRIMRGNRRTGKEGIEQRKLDIMEERLAMEKGNSALEREYKEKSLGYQMKVADANIKNIELQMKNADPKTKEALKKAEQKELLRKELYKQATETITDPTELQKAFDQIDKRIAGQTPIYGKEVVDEGYLGGLIGRKEEEGIVGWNPAKK